MPLASVLLAATLQASCPPSDGLQGICGPVASEDLVRIGNTPWLVASGLNVGTPAHLYLIDTRTRRSRPLFPQGQPRMRVDPAFKSVCPAPPKLDALSLDGLALRPAARGSAPMLLAANHGDRRSIEIFRIDGGNNPSLTWIGCVPMPKGTLPNAVAPLADGGLIATSFRNPDAPPDENTGGIWEWHADSGWHRLPIGDVPGANGLALSPDERTLYVSAWSARRLLVLNRNSPTGKEIPLDFLPDNLHWAPDGSLLVAGQRAQPKDITACGASSCPQEWTVARVDVASLAVTPILNRKGSEIINYVCGALQVGDTLYLTLRGAPRVAWVNVRELH
jgi:hypothetical protein